MKKSWIIGCIVLIIILIVAWYLISPAFRVVEKQETISEQADVLAQGNFIASAHEVKGKAILFNEEEKRILRFENFETINGPDLYIYLSNDLSANDFIDIGKIKATKGNINYEIPENVDTTKYNKVLVWCKAFKVLFSYAELKK